VAYSLKYRMGEAGVASRRVRAAREEPMRRDPRCASA